MIFSTASLFQIEFISISIFYRFSTKYIGECLITILTLLIFIILGMGNSQKQKEINKRQHNHLRLRTARQHFTNGKSTIQAQFSVSSKSQFTNWQNKLKKSPAATAKHALIPSQLTSKSGMCGGASSVKATYPPYWHLLSDEIKSRKKQRKEVNESQIWQILYSLSETASEYHKSHQKTGDIRPSNILLNQAGDLKLATIHSWPDEQINYIKTLRNGQKTYLSPEQFKDVGIGRTESYADIQKGEAFSIGLTCLDCLQLSDSYGLYPKKGEFDENLLQSRRSQLKREKISKQLKAVLLSLTDPSPNNRVAPREIYGWLKNNEVQIYNNYTFTPKGQVPRNISQFLNKNDTRQNNLYRSNANREQISQYQTRYVPSNTLNQREHYQSEIPKKQPINTYSSQVSRPSYNGEKQPVYPNYQSRVSHISDVPQSYSPRSNVMNEKPPATIKTRYLTPSQIGNLNNIGSSSLQRQSGFNSHNDTNSRFTLRDIYTSPEIVPRSSYYRESGVPKSQQKQIRGTYGEDKSSFRPQTNQYNNRNQNFRNHPNELNKGFEKPNNSPPIQNEEQVDYNRNKIASVLIKRGSQQEMITAEVEEDYPSRTKLTNWKIDEDRGTVPKMYASSGRGYTPSSDYSQPQSKRHSQHSTNNNKYFQNSNSRIPVIHETSEEDSRLRSVGRDTPPRSNIQPIQSVYESEDENYKLSFFNNSRIPRAMGSQQNGIMKANSAQQQIPSGYQPSPVIQTSSEHPQKMIVAKKKHIHQKQDEEQIRSKMNSQMNPTDN